MVVVGDGCHEFDVDIAEEGEERARRGATMKGCWFAVALVASLFAGTFACIGAGAVTSAEGRTECGAAPLRVSRLLVRHCNNGPSKFAV
jgi:hypothetical protein